MWLNSTSFKGVTSKPVIAMEQFHVTKDLIPLAESLEKEKDLGKFLAKLEEVPANTYDTHFAHLATAYTYNHLLLATGAGDYATGKKIVQAFLVLSGKINRSSKYADEFIATAVSLAQLSDDKELKNIVFRQLFPPYIGNSRLAYNLACFYAIKDEKRSVFLYIRIALDLGRKKERFLKDSDFASFLNDPEFRTLLGPDSNQAAPVPPSPDAFTPMIQALSVLSQKIKEAGSQSVTVFIGKYISKLNELMTKDWAYALGNDVEIEDVLLPKEYLAQREKVLANLEYQLSNCAYRYRSSKKGSQENKNAIALYHEIFAEALRINGKVFVIPPDTELSDEDMPRIYRDFWR